MRPTLAACALALALPLASAQDAAYVPPKGAYDNPASFFRPLKAVGETYEHTLGAPQTNGYQRQVRLKLIGMENLSRLTTLKETIQQSDDAQQKRAASSSAWSRISWAVRGMGIT